MADDVVKMHHWQGPLQAVGGEFPTELHEFYPLVVHNSLTRSKVRFVPRGNRVLWYMCGPTVYDESHMGHARTYLHFDILMRIMTDYFNYNVVMVMNVTDVDDKIILRANTNKINFKELSRHFENDFMDDMKKLGIRPPDHITRVSEFIPEIISYTEKIISNGYAYESNGSVYFDVEAYHSKDSHHYGKLLPEGLGNAELLAEGEGALSNACAGEKKSATDFALWKKSKEGEPEWDSPWGRGRPGWHIECSAMASKTFEMYGDGCMDIHSGGIDLRFPHHDNEIAQAEAHYDCNQWVNYFLHTGHLHIKGFKMSKSLKNFITIKRALENHSSRQIRLLFLLHKYNDPMDYGDNTMAGALAAEKTFVEFFHSVKGILREFSPNDQLKMGQSEQNLIALLESAKNDIKIALCDDFDTPIAIKILISNCVRPINKYIQEKEELVERCHCMTVRLFGEFVTQMFKVFGLVETGISVGFDPEPNGSGRSREETIGPILNVLSNFRSKVRNASRSNDLKTVMEACDEIRDNELPLLGIRLEDKGENAVWKLDDPAVLAAEKAKKEAEILRKKIEKEENIRKAEQKAEEKAARDKIPPEMLYQNQLIEIDGVQKPKYTAFDTDGVPTHDVNGLEMTKNALKTLRKEWAKQKAAHEKFIASQES